MNELAVGPMTLAVDVLALAAELSVYVVAGWWAWTLRRLPRAVRLVVAVVAVAVLALVWGEFASPTATHALHGAPRAGFEICWYGAGALAAFLAWRSGRSGKSGRPPETRSRTKSPSRDQTSDRA